MPSERVVRIQRRLKDKGFDPGEIDGIWGRHTIAAVRMFQEANGLKIDGVVGPKTVAALFAAAPTEVGTGAVPSTPSHSPTAGASGDSDVLIPWLEEAKHLVGTKEVLGEGSSPVILEWAQDLDLRYKDDDVPWCGLFVAHCIGSTLPEEVLPTNPLRARHWERFGDEAEARLGAVMVFWRVSPTAGKGHVGFYVGEDRTAFQILGGNQSNRVCLTWIAKDRLLGARWPKVASFITSKTVIKRRDQGLSTNEGQ